MNNSGAHSATVVDQIRHHRGGQGRLTVVGTDGSAVSTSWRSLHSKALRIAAQLDLGAKTGRRPPTEAPTRPRVGFLADTGIELVTAIQAAWLAGATITVLPLPIGISPEAHRAQVRAMAADADLDLLVLGDPCTPLEWPLSRITTVVRLEMLSGLAAGAGVAGTDPVATAPAPDDLALLQYSSGSTRTPRAVPVTHRHLASNLRAIRLATGHERVDHGTMLSWLPLYHDLGLIGFLALPMACGCSVVLLSPLTFASRPWSWLEAVTRYRPTASGAPNFVYALMTSLLTDRHDLDLGSLRFLLCGGEPIDATVMSRFAAAAAPAGLDATAIVPAYGLAEATLGVTFSARGAGVQVDDVDPELLETTGHAQAPGPGRTGRRLVRLGRPVPGTALRVVDRRRGTPLPERRVGRIEISGPSVIRHYWREPTPATGGWLDTGDLGYLANGELVVCGRQKDVIFAAGRTVFPQDVEAAAALVPGVRAGGVAAVALHRPEGDQLVVAVETRRLDGAAARSLRHEVRAAVRTTIGITPHDVVVLPPHALPRTSSGKLRRAETGRRYAHDLLADVEEGLVRR